MRMAIPFSGLDSPGTVSRQNAWPITVNNIIEQQKSLMPYLKAVTGRTVKPRDIMLMEMDELENADIMVASPPCQPHTRGGKNLGRNDARSEPFLKAITVARELRERRELKVCPCGVPLWCAPVVCPYGVPLWCARVVSPYGVRL